MTKVIRELCESVDEQQLQTGLSPHTVVRLRWSARVWKSCRLAGARLVGREEMSTWTRLAAGALSGCSSVVPRVRLTVWISRTRSFAGFLPPAANTERVGLYSLSGSFTGF